MYDTVSLNSREEKVDPREREDTMLNRCVEVAYCRELPPRAESGREANVFRVAAMVIQSRFPAESQALMDCAARYFELHPADLRPAADVVRKGDVISLPRLRDSLTRKFKYASGQ
jgi:hypothetical protein